jgi:hypothetical protein
MTGPVTYHEARDGNLADRMARYRELAEHHALARAIVIRKARGTFKPNEHVNEGKYPPLTVAEHLEMLALGECIARYYRHPSQVHAAVQAGPAGSRSRPPPAPLPRLPGWLTGSGRRVSTGFTRTPAGLAWTTLSTTRRSAGWPPAPRRHRRTGDE